MTRSTQSLFGASLLLFLVVGDMWFPPGSPWAAARVPILAVAAVAALSLVARRPSLLRPLLRFPTVLFVAFAALDLAASLMADHPRASLRYAVGYLVVAVVAVAAAGSFPKRMLLDGLLGTVLAKTVLSLAVAAAPSAWSWPGPRFQGALGSPNPMGATAALAYLLLVVYGWYRWRSALSRSLLVVAGGVAATTTLAATRSASAATAVLGALAVAATVGGIGKEGWRRRAAWLAVAVALLAPLLLLPSAHAGSSVTGRSAPAATALELRGRWWGMLVPVVLRQPWFGYGAGSTMSLSLPGRPPWGTSAHNLYLEAALYAGIPAALAMLLFIAGGVALAVRGALATRAAPDAALAGVMTFYAALSLVEPVVLNGVPSTLVVPLVAAAACAMNVGDEREDRP